MLARYRKNNYPFWLYRQVNTDVTADEVIEHFRTADSENYLLQRIQMQWVAIGDADPTAYADIEIILRAPQQNKTLIDIPVPMQIVTSPGHYNTFTGSTDQPNQMYYRSAKINWPIISQATFSLIFSNYLGAANPESIDVMIEGRNVFKPRRVS